MTQWIADFYSVVDKLDLDALAEVTSPDIKVAFANNPPTVGFPQLADSLSMLWGGIDSMSHTPVRLWEISDSGWGAIEAVIRYVRKDGAVVDVPNMSTIHRNDEGVIDELHAYVDLTPLFG